MGCLTWRVHLAWLQFPASCLQKYVEALASCLAELPVETLDSAAHPDPSTCEMLRLNELLQEAKQLGGSLAMLNPAVMRRWHTNIEHTTTEALLASGRAQAVVVSLAVYGLNSNHP